MENPKLKDWPMYRDTDLVITLHSHIVGLSKVEIKPKGVTSWLPLRIEISCSEFNVQTRTIICVVMEQMKFKDEEFYWAR